jgi:hypothetical protein
MSSPSHLHRLFFESFPAAFLKETVSALERSYRLAQEDCMKFDGNEAHDVFSHIRRAHFQTEWRRIAKAYPTLDATSVENEAGNAFHTKVRGGSIVLTESAVNASTEIPRRALFRATYARRPQMAFTSFGIDDPPPPAEASAYAILAHGPRGAGRIVSPHFAFVGFPTADCDEYVHRISLNHLLDDNMPDSGETFPMGPTPDLGPANPATDELRLRLKPVQKADKKDE